MKRFRTQNFLATKLVLKEAADQAVATNKRLQFAVPKKLLKRAVDRNAVRRIGKESWRAAESRVGGLSPDDASRVQVRIRLLSRPKQFLALSRPARKRYWRQELDQLLSKVVT